MLSSRRKSLVCEFNTRIPNDSEAECARRLRSAGWLVTKRGWPDFFAWNEETGEIAFIEVKQKRTHNLKISQRHIMEIMASRGIQCWLFTPDSSFVKIVGKPLAQKKLVKS
jgi:hypothetical protein